MNWMICYDYGKESHHVFSDMINNKDSAVDAIKAYQEKYDDNEIRIVAVIPVAFPIDTVTLNNFGLAVNVIVLVDTASLVADGTGFSNPVSTRPEYEHVSL